MSFSFKKSIMVQHTPTLNSSITILKKLPTNNNQLSPRSIKRNQPPILPLGHQTTTIKLPVLVKRTPSSSNIYLLKYEKEIPVLV